MSDSCTCGACDECMYRKGMEDAHADRDAQDAKIKMIKTINMFVRPPGGQQYRLFKCTYQFEDDLTDPQIRQVMREIHDIGGSVNIVDATPTETIKSRGTDVLVIRDGEDVLRIKFDTVVTNEEIHRGLLVDGTLKKGEGVRIVPTPPSTPLEVTPC